MRATVCSAAESTLLCGALTTMTPRLVASSTSTLSTPTPARPTTCSFSPAAITSAVTLVAERMMSPWYSGMRGQQLVGVPLRADVDLEALVLEVLDALGGQLLLDEDLLLFGHVSSPPQSGRCSA